MIEEKIHKQLRSQYNPDGSLLRNLQLRMLEILKCIDSICEKHNIRYWLSSGTLLGAMRHGGFIPWDDDVDIEMLREDYIKLMEILPKELPEQYVLQNNKTDSNYVYLYAKVRDRNSLIEEKCPVNQKFVERGAFVDIFMLENSFFIFNKISAPLFNRMIFGMALKKGFLKYIYKANCFLLLKLLFPLFRLLSKLSSTKSLRHTFGVNFIKKQRFYDDIFPLKKIEFEGLLFNAPFDCDAYLTKLYGNYMKIPQNIETHIVEDKIKLW